MTVGNEENTENLNTTEAVSSDTEQATESTTTGSSTTQSTTQSTTTSQQSCRAQRVVAPPQDVVLASTSLALALTKGRSQYEIETLINLFSLTTDNLQAILAQVLINNKVQNYLETNI